MANKKKVTTAVVAGVTAAALLLGGTFAWQSINQTALNEKADVVNPGGRLHDDFNGSNKDVYVENFAEDPIFARVRLEEFFEITQAGGTVHSIAGERDDEGNVSYVLHNFNSTNATDAYWDWTTGGSTVYMPTFNKNKDSLVADVNGTYEGPDGIVTNDANDDRYTDYVEYYLDEVVSDNAIYDYDSNDDDEVGNAFDNWENYPENVTAVYEEHIAQNTLGATLMSMQEWNDLGSPVGECWVYDTDGWVYWAAPIAPGDATGLLLDSIALDEKMDDSWYYAINVVAQFVTANDLGEEDGSGFYDANAGTPPTTAALELLKQIDAITEEDEEEEETKYLYGVSVSTDEKVYLGSTDIALKATYVDDETGEFMELEVTDWALNYTSLAENTTLTKDGLLTVDSSETWSYIPVSGKVAEGKYAGYRFNSDVSVTMPWLHVVEVDVNGNQVPYVNGCSMLLAAGDTKYYKVSNATVYGEDKTYSGYEDFEFNKDTVTWDLYGEYPFSAEDEAYSKEWNEDGTLLKLTHICDPATCDCAWIMHIGALLSTNPTVSGFNSAFFYKSDENVDTLHLGVDYYASEEALNSFERTTGWYTCTAENQEQEFNITAYVSENMTSLSFAVGEYSTASLKWYDESGNSLFNDDGYYEVDGIDYFSSSAMTLNPEKKIEELTLIGKYEANETWLDPAIKITLNFNFVWVE